MSNTNNDKYDFQNGYVVNRATGKPIPADEPVIILRAQDRHALRALDVYRAGLTPGPHRQALDAIFDSFMAFNTTHPTAIKEPDTIPTTSVAFTHHDEIHDEGTTRQFWVCQDTAAQAEQLKAAGLQLLSQFGRGGDWTFTVACPDPANAGKLLAVSCENAKNSTEAVAAAIKAVIADAHASQFTPAKTSAAEGAE